MTMLLTTTTTKQYCPFPRQSARPPVTGQQLGGGPQQQPDTALGLAKGFPVLL